MSKKFYLNTDASVLAVVACMSQMKDGIYVFIAYERQILNPHQRIYLTIDRELYAILSGCRKFQHYLLGAKFTLLTDHNPLKKLKEMKDIRGKKATYILELEEYNKDIQCIRRNKNLVAEELS